MIRHRLYFFSRIISCILAACFFSLASPAQDSCRLRISLLTCGPGEELFSIWGHTAIRVSDTVSGADIVFNYGTFDDTDPYFYLKFTRGIMVYSLSTESFRDFMLEYQYEKRSVVEQTLSLDCRQKETLYQSLRVNASELNRFYNYHFYADNCTTRARDIVRFHNGADISIKNILPPEKPSYRELIHFYLDKGEQPWSKLGIDLLLGNHLDQKVTNLSSMFLPDYLETGFDSAFIDNQHLVKEKKWILVPQPVSNPKIIFGPFIVFLLLFLCGIILSVWTSIHNRWLHIFHFVLFFAVGLLGILITILWMARVDTVCRDNWNIAWALPTHSVMAFFIRSQNKWVKRYFLLTISLCLVLLLGWKWIPQELNPATIPLITLILFSSIRILQKKKS